MENLLDLAIVYVWFGSLIAGIVFVDYLHRD
jgi:hypothetical protein